MRPGSSYISPVIRLVTGSLIAGILALMTACSTPVVSDRPAGSEATPEGMTGREENLLQSLLARGATAESPEKEEILYQAAALLRNYERDNDALELLDNLNTEDIPLTLAADILLFRAQLYSDYNQPQLALQMLNNSRLNLLPQLSESRQIAIRLLKAELYEQNTGFLESVQERILVDPMLPRNLVPANHERIWNALTELNAERLRALAEQERRFLFQGWYELGVIGKAYQYNLDRQVVELARWKTSWIRHPAAIYLPQAMQLVETMAAERPGAIALLLPLNSVSGTVIRNGFMSAYFDVMQIGGKVPAIRLYDTSRTQDIMEIYNLAVEDGAEMIIGPLEKQHVARLHEVRSLPVPTLALNNVEESRPVSSLLYQFALSPENEAVQIAERAWHDGHRYAAILSPRQVTDDFYQRKRNSFIEHWLNLGGQIVAEETYREDYTGTVEALLDIDDSETRKDRLTDLIGKQVEFTQRRRQDIDCIFLIAEPGPARQINPTLAYLYAGDIPVYASQDVYSGIPRPLVDNDLNGIIFGDSPWLLNFNDELKSKTSRLFPQNNALNLRLQAFGIDAFRIYPRLKQLESVPDSRIFGATGLLKLGDNHNIIRELSWARVNEGLAVTEEGNE